MINNIGFREFLELYPEVRRGRGHPLAAGRQPGGRAGGQWLQCSSTQSPSTLLLVDLFTFTGTCQEHAFAA